MNTPQQQKVIDTHNGVALVKACPGSGKTTTLVNRCKALPVRDSKLVLAFNKKAAEDFQRRLGQVSMCDVRTFHSFCMREIYRDPRRFGFYGKPSLVEESLFRQLNRANNKQYISWEDSPWDQDFIKECEHSIYTAELQKMFLRPKGPEESSTAYMRERESIL